MSDPPCPKWWAEDYGFLTAMELIADVAQRGYLPPILQDLFDDCFSQHFFWLGREALPR